MTKVLEPTVRPEPVLGSSHGWPQTLFVVQWPDGRYAFLNADTEGLEKEPMVFNGLATHPTEASVEEFLRVNTYLPEGGEAKQVHYEKAREIAIDKKADALILLEGPQIVDVEFLK